MRETLNKIARTSLQIGIKLKTFLILWIKRIVIGSAVSIDEILLDIGRRVEHNRLPTALEIDFLKRNMWNMKVRRYVTRFRNLNTRFNELFK